MQPLISVLTATYNRPQLLREAVQSILGQTFVNFELIVINDGGSDVSPVLREFDDPRIVYLNLPENRGKAYALNRGLEIARGKYIAYLDDDDHFFRHHLGTLLCEIEAHPEVDLVYSDFEEVQYQRDGQGRRRELKRLLVYSRDFDRVELLKANYIPHPTVLHRKEAVDKYGGFDESCRCLIDWELFHRLAFYCGFRHVRQVTGEYFINREKGDHITNLHTTQPQYYWEHFYRIRRQLPPRPWSKVTPATLVIKPHHGETSVGRYLIRLMAATPYPYQMILVDTGELLAGLPNADWLHQMNIEVVRVQPDQDALAVAAQAAFGDVLFAFETGFMPPTDWLYPLVRTWEQSSSKEAVRLSSGSKLSTWEWMLSRAEALKGTEVLVSCLQVQPPEESCQVSIIIPVRNKLEFTRRCLESLWETRSDLRHEIIVVDNASDDGTKEYLQELAEQGLVTHLLNDPPLPFAASCNRGAQAAKGKYLLFLNNDTVASPGWMEELVKTIQSAPGIGAVGAKLLYPNRTIQHAGVVFHRYKSQDLTVPYHIFKGFEENHPAVNRERDFRALTGACLLTPAQVFRALGGFDERFVNCYEDVDYCLRLHAHGHRLVYTPKAQLIHFESQTSGRSDYVLEAGRILQQKWGSQITGDDLNYLQEAGLTAEEGEDGRLSICESSELQQWKQAIAQLIELGAWQQAQEEIERLEQLVGARDAEVLTLRASCALSCGKLALARAAFTEAQQLDQIHPDPAWGLAQVALAQDKQVEARSRLRRLIADYPEDPRQGRWRHVLEEIQKAQGARIEA